VANGAVLVKPTLDVEERARRIRWVFLDVDGTLTDGRVYVLSDGTDGRAFHVLDGHAIKLGQQAGLRFALLSGRRSAAVEIRARELGIEELHQGILDKGPRIDEILDRLGVAPDAVCFMGDDLVDLPAMRRAGLAAAPADAVDEVRRAAHVVTTRRGGEGAVREVVELLLRTSGEWDRVTQHYHER
jgi:3-deoxy-D-manno-octulosonate 8-phosphate phosphatase (KDO 8-P phosphatase)